jgi:hypothetical protein
MRLATFVSIGFAFGLVLLAVQARRPHPFAEPKSLLLSIPLVWSFFLLHGARRIVNIPSRLEANWVFQLTQERPLRHYLAGLRKGIIFFLVLPMVIAVMFFSSLLWGVKTGSILGLGVLFLSVLLMEILFFDYNKIPFACAYLPGQVKAHLLWPAYILSFFAYLSLSVALERILRQNSSSFFYFLAAILIVLGILRFFQKRRIERNLELVFEEQPEPVLFTLLTSSHE